MSATLGDPVLLATYGTPSSLRKGKGKEVAVDEHPFVFATFSTIPKRDEEQVVLAVQGDGIYIYELGDLHPVSSRTLGPSTSFASAPATLLCTEGENVLRRTYVAVHSAHDVKKEDAGRVIWTWKEPLSGHVGSSQNRQSTKLPHDIAYLATLQDVNSVVAVSRSGILTLMDLDLNTKNTWSPEDISQKVVKIFTFSARDCSFIQASGYILVMFFGQSDGLIVQIVALGSEDELTPLDPLEVPLGEVDNVVEISLDPSGNMTILGSNGAWYNCTLVFKHGSTSLSSGHSPLHLKSLTFISDKERRAPSVSLLSLSSSFVLLAGTTSKEIALLLWDVQYGVLLHSTMLPIPSSLDGSANGVSVQLLRGSGSQVLLILSPRTDSLKRNGQLRSSLLLVPFSVPKRSTIAAAMGKAAQGARWLVDNSSESKQEEDVLGKEAMLANLQEATANGQTTRADDIFFDWVKERDERVKGKKGGDIDAPEPQDAEMANGDEQKPKETKKSPPLKSILDHALVTRIMSIILSEETASKEYSPKICRYLVSKHLVSHSMVKGGLLDALVQRNDWESIRACFWFVVDLPESELLRLLRIVVKRHRNQSLANEDIATGDKESKKKSRADEWQGILSISSFLARVVDYPASQAAWRTALREHFADIEDLMCLLSIADEWIDTFTTKDLPIGLGEVKQNEHGVFVPEQGKSSKTARPKSNPIPSLENLLSFLQAILDSSFLALLQSPESYPLLQRISENVAQIHSANLELQSLRGPLEPFARAQSKAVAEAASGGKKREEVDWRKRRKQAHEQAALSLGPYQVEELVF